MKVTNQFPKPKIEIFTFDATPKLTLSVADKTGLLSYSFTESIDNPSGQFTFSVSADSWYNPKKKEGTTYFDVIDTLDIIKIYEGGSKPVFIGVVRKRHFSASMGSSGVSKRIVFSGEGIAGLFNRYEISLDLRLMNVNNPDAERLKFTTAFTSETEPPTPPTITHFLEKSWDLYRDFEIQGNAIKTSKMADVIETFFKKNGTSFVEAPKEQHHMQYDIANTFYTQGVNNIFDIWRNMLPSPFYEIFCRINKEGVPKIVVREAPFDAQDWKELPCYDIDIIDLTAYDVAISDEEVYTVFSSYLEGSPLSPSTYVILAQVEDGKNATLILDEEKFSVYGYKPLIVSYCGYNKANNEKPENTAPLQEKFTKMNQRMHDWFYKLDEMSTGTISIITNFSETDNKASKTRDKYEKKGTNFNEPDKYPKIGTRCRVLGGEFYIRSSDHSWSYGGTPITSLAIGRGGIYNQEGFFQKQIPNLGKTLLEVKG